VKILTCDSFVKSPFSTLRCILRHCDVAISTSHSLGFARLETGAFYFAVPVRSLFVLTATLVIIAGFMVGFVFAEGEDLKENKKIYITADKLIADSEAKCAEFIGNVRAVQEDTVITADRLKIFYKKVEDNNKNLTSDEGSIEKIISSGNVKINFDDKVAVAEHAVYTSETGVLVLTGPNSKVTSGTNFVSGEKITLYRAEDRMTVESGNKKRVEAVFYSKEKGIE
jgi:lipopolysaccharide export system protein LptA